ncbi:sigma factor-like helix-turn-helix DNA-binding protein [Flavivirga rizhaonensis]|uniref:RNA polymerase sigma factor 70 region 4 type 2 domain-containing protein n=1 Tax=Flavivirga rizhaonensis TaxID=2559571 RepID=A0A4S1E2A2_9FLAO|nr:hypothetical protein EM932_00820 [Flavivirga rizhaonensis]
MVINSLWKPTQTVLQNSLLILTRQKLGQIIESLPPVCQEVLKLNKFGSLKFDEIAKKLKASKASLYVFDGLLTRKKWLYFIYKFLIIV